MSSAPVTTVKRDQSGFMLPLLALWSLGGLIGIPSLLLSIGYLVEKGHNSLLAPSPPLLSSGSEDWVYRGTTWIIFTLRILLFDRPGWLWSISLLGIGILSWWLWRQFLAQRTESLAQRLPSWLTSSIPFSSFLGLFFLGLPLSFIEINLIAYQSSALLGKTDADQDVMLRDLLESSSYQDLRQQTYYILSAGCLVVVVGLVGLIRSMGSTPSSTSVPLGESNLNTDSTPSSTSIVIHVIINPPVVAANEGSTPSSASVLIRSLAQFATLAIYLFVLLNWPMCFGRLIISYNRPVIEFQEEAEKGVFGFPVRPKKVREAVVLNPQASTWVICSKRRNPSSQSAPELNVVEPKTLKEFQVKRHVYLFDYLRSVQGKEGKAASTSPPASGER